MPINGKVITKPIRGSNALERLSSIADRFLGGPRRVDVVKLVEESLEREIGLR